MGYLNFKNGTVEEIFRRFKWTRNNTIEIFKAAEDNKVLDKTITNNSKFEFKSTLFQFQCIATTTDTYKRKLLKDTNKSFGVIIQNGNILKKEGIKAEDLLKILQNQTAEMEDIYKDADLQNIIELIKVIDHEHMHHGELILLLRANGVDLPERFKKSWNL